MDSVFQLDAVARGYLLRGVAQLLGCAHICLWSYLPHPSNCLVFMDGWLHEEGSSSSSGNLVQRLFDVYRGSFCSIDNNTVPGLVYREGPEGWPYVMLGESGARELASLPAQRQFYQEAGIKTSIFIGCKSGVVELGMPYLTDTNLYNNIRSLFSEEIIQQVQRGELIQLADHVRPSSSSSSLRTFSGGSPDSSPLLFSKGIITSSEPRPTQVLPVLPQQIIPTQFFSQQRDDAAMARAMLAVISASSGTSQSILQQPKEINRMSSPIGAFMVYNSSHAPMVELRQNSQGQTMAKMAISILRKIHLMNIEAWSHESRPTDAQLLHAISERRRRQKLSESFLALKSMLPRTKKDKASILANAKHYLNALKAQVSELEEKNKTVEAQLQLSNDDEHEEGSKSNERVDLQITRTSDQSASTSAQRITVRIMREECDMTDLALRVLECLGQMKGIILESVDARTMSNQLEINVTFARLILTLQVKAEDWDEETFKEALRRAVESVAAQPETSPNPG